MVSYKKRMIVLTSRPIPPDPVPKNKKRHLALLARNIDDVADANAEYAARLAALQAPTPMLGVKSTTEALFEVVADDNHRLAEAMRRGEEKTFDQVTQQGQVNELAATKNVQLALKQIGGTSPRLQNFIDEQRRDVNK